MALVKHKDSPNWYWRLYVNGKPKQGSCFTTNKAVAARYEAKKRAEFEEQIRFGKKESLTTRQALQEYLDSTSAEREWSNIQTRVNKLLGMKNDKRNNLIDIHGLDPDRPFEKLTTGDVQRVVLGRRKEGTADATILSELVTLSMAIRLNKRLGYAVPDIDLAQIKRESGLKPAKQRLRWLTRDEEKALLAELHGDTYDLVVLLLSTGARYSEIAEMEWSSIDLEKREIHLYRSKVRNESVIPMSDRAYEVLKRRRDAMSGVYLFEAKDGTVRKYANKAFNNAVARAGLSGVTLHTLRHTVASRVAQNGMSANEIQHLLGHTTPAMSTRYIHLMPNQAVNKAISILNKLDGE